MQQHFIVCNFSISPDFTILHSHNFMCGNLDWAWTIILIPESLNKANLFLDYNNQIMYSSQYQIKYLRGCHRSGNAQGKKFFKVREMSGNFIVQFQKMSILPHRRFFVLHHPFSLPLEIPVYRIFIHFFKKFSF